MKKKKAKITLSIDPDLLRKLKRLAELDSRSVAGYVTLIIKNHIEGDENN